MNNRYRNPYFWFGLIGVVLSAMGMSPEMFTSWELVRQAAVDLVSNPFLLVTVVMAVMGVFVDPTTKGLKDKKNNKMLL